MTKYLLLITVMMGIAFNMGRIHGSDQRASSQAKVQQVTLEHQAVIKAESSSGHDSHMKRAYSGDECDGQACSRHRHQTQCLMCDEALEPSAFVPVHRFQVFKKSWYHINLYQSPLLKEIAKPPSV